jgi:catechol 2,3-dioxygenase-like lactoylglutathione lyase family enzyme
MAQSLQLVFACEDPARMTDFWSAALGYIPQPPPPGFDTWEAFADSMGIPEEARNDISAVVDPDEDGPRILFERWDAGAPSKRFHLDINAVGEVDDKEARLAEERTRLEALGATFGRVATGMAGEVWMEMYDPEGNWFCVQ